MSTTITTSGGTLGVDVDSSEIAAATLVIESEGIASNDNDTTLPTSAAVKDYADGATATFTNKTFDANGTGNSLSNVDVADLANGTDGELITWGADAVPTTVAVGTSGHVLTSNGAGAAPTFQAVSGGDTVDKYFIPAGAWVVDDATFSFASLFGPYLVFTDNVDNEAYFNFMIPTGYTSISSIDLILLQNAASGDVDMYFECIRYRDGVAKVADNEGFTAITIDVNGVTDLLAVPSTAYDGLTETTGDVIGVQIARNGNGANDTLNANMLVGGAIVTFS